MASHKPNCFGQARGPGGNSVEGRNHLKIEAAGINLPYIREDAGNTEVGCDTGFQFKDFVSVTFKEAELVELGANSSFQATYGIVFDEGV